MNLLDVRTAVFGFVTVNAICFIVMAFSWFQNRERFVPRRVSEAHNYLLLAAFLFLQSYFAVVHSMTPHPYFGGPGT